MHYAGIDIGKRSHWMCVTDAEGNVVMPACEYSADADGYAAMVSDLSAYPEVAAGMEATGHYWRTCHASLSGAGVAVTVINPVRTNAMRDFSNLGRAKTDRIDCLVIADTLRVSGCAVTGAAPDSLARLRELSRFQQSLRESVTGVKQRLTVVLDQVWPEFSRLFSSAFTDSALAVLRAYGTPAAVAGADPSEVSSLLGAASRNRFRDAKAREVIDSAVSTCGIPSSAAHAIEVRLLVEQYDLLATQSREVEAELGALLSEVAPQVATVPGISVRLGSQIVAEVGDVSRFPTPSHLVSYAGLDPTRRQSGAYDQERNRISKKGSPYLRRALYLAANANIRIDSEFRGFYDAQRARGRCHKYATVATARKMLCVVWALLRSGEDYDPDVHRGGREAPEGASLGGSD